MRPEVWAPRAARVDVVLGDGAERRLVAEAGGWHRGDGGLDLPHGATYAFRLDGGDPLPDPRSHHQPAGIDGPSAVVDHRCFGWTDDGWRGFLLPGSVLYELHIGTFTAAGTFDGAIERLDHLVDLGIDAVEVMPVAEAMGKRGWGYDGVLLYAPHHAYGGPDGFKRFVDACHVRGLGVLLDVVYNHLGPRGNHLDRFGPYFHDAHTTPWGSAVNLDGPDSAEVRRFVVDNARHWFVDHHVDGLRLDAVHAVADDSPTHVVAELAEETAGLAAHLGRPLWLVAEREQNEVVPVWPRESGGWGLDARWADDLHHALHAAITGERDGYYAPFSSLADVASAVRDVHVHRGEPVPPDVPGHRFVVCSQNHDQIGNRALGERLHHLAGIDAALAAAAIVLCSPAVPLLFQGEEWCASAPFPFFCDTGGDEALAAAIVEGRRSEFEAFGWDPTLLPDPVDPTTAAKAALNWIELDQPDHARALAWYRSLLRLRRERSDLTDGRRQLVGTEVDEEQRILVVRRAATAVAVNLSPEARTLPAAWFEPRAGAVLAATHDGAAVTDDGDVLLPGGCTAVVTRRGGNEAFGGGPSGE